MQTTITVSTDDRLEAIDVTDRVASALAAEAGDLEAGTCHVASLHTTAGVCLNEAEPRLLGDLEALLADVVPDAGHAHDALDGNAAAHLRATLVGCEVTAPVSDGGLALGTWQSILLVECDGPRRRELRVTVTPAE